MPVARKVWLPMRVWMPAALKPGFDGADTGIDLVAEKR